MNTIDERTKISLYAVAMVVPIVVAVLIWTLNVATTAADAKDLAKTTGTELNRKYDDVKSYLIEIDKRTIRIEESLKHRSK